VEIGTFSLMRDFHTSGVKISRIPPWLL